MQNTAHLTHTHIHAHIDICIWIYVFVSLCLGQTFAQIKNRCVAFGDIFKAQPAHLPRFHIQLARSVCVRVCVCMWGTAGIIAAWTINMCCARHKRTLCSAKGDRGVQGWLSDRKQMRILWIFCMWLIDLPFWLFVFVYCSYCGKWSSTLVSFCCCSTLCCTQFVWFIVCDTLYHWSFVIYQFIKFKFKFFHLHISFNLFPFDLFLLWYPLRREQQQRTRQTLMSNNTLYRHVGPLPNDWKHALGMNGLWNSDSQIFTRDKMGERRRER